MTMKVAPKASQTHDAFYWDGSHYADVPEACAFLDRFQSVKYALVIRSGIPSLEVWTDKSDVIKVRNDSYIVVNPWDQSIHVLDPYEFEMGYNVVHD